MSDEFFSLPAEIRGSAAYDHDLLWAIDESDPAPVAKNTRETTILVIDDDPDHLALFKNILGREGYNVLSVSDANGAFNVLARKHVDLIVSDIFLPDLDGFDIATYVSTVQKFPRSSAVPIILVTGGRDELESTALESGADMFCPKIKVRELLVKQVKFLLQ